MDPSCAQDFAIRQLSSPPSLLPSFSIALDLIFCPSEMSTLQQLQLQLHFHNNDKKKKKKKRRRTLGGTEWDGGKCITLRRISDSDRVVSSRLLSFPLGSWIFFCIFPPPYIPQRWASNSVSVSSNVRRGQGEKTKSETRGTRTGISLASTEIVCVMCPCLCRLLLLCIYSAARRSTWDETTLPPPPPFSHPCSTRLASLPSLSTTAAIGWWRWRR